jgi:hypothetical protein
MHQAPDQCSCGLAREGWPWQVYNEEAFRYFLAIERRRSEISRRPFLLLLVDLKPLRVNERIEPALVDKLFSALWSSLRETDFIGWYRDERVVGAVLTQPAEVGGKEMCRQARERITRMMIDRLPEAVGDRLQVRVYQLPPSLKGRF